MAIDTITFLQHLKRYMPDVSFTISFEKFPIKVVRLEDIRSYLKFPTTLFKPQYNIIIHITRGTIEAQVGLTKITAKEKSVLLMLSNKILAREFLSEDLEGFGLIIEDNAFPNLLSSVQMLKIFEINPHFLLSENDHKTIAALNSLLVDECKHKNSNNDFTHAITQGVLVKLLAQSENVNSLARREEIAFSFKQLVYRHFQQEHTIAFYANSLCISESYLNKCVKSVFQKSSKEIWTEIIIQYSQVLLQNDTKEIAEIAYMLNFSDPSYFGRLFKQTTGVTPTYYRKQSRPDLSEYVPD
jgi:AraC-like DNA-binding protein